MISVSDREEKFALIPNETTTIEVEGNGSYTIVAQYQGKTDTKVVDIENLENEFEFELIAESDTWRITKYKGKDTKVEFPSEYKGKKVTAIGRGNSIWDSSICDSSIITSAYCLTQNTIEAIKIPEGVKEIGAYAFDASIALKKVILPSTLEKIGYRAFWNTNNLKNIFIPSGVEQIETEAFCGTLAGAGADHIIRLEGTEKPGFSTTGKYGEPWSGKAQVIPNSTRTEDDIWDI